MPYIPAPPHCLSRCGTGEIHTAIEDIAAERDQLRYERRLLRVARMTLDLVAAGGPERWDLARSEAEDVAQRIVDEIGHSVTDEPALGPHYREQIATLTAEAGRLRAELAEMEIQRDAARAGRREDDAYRPLPCDRCGRTPEIDWLLQDPGAEPEPGAEDH